MVYEVEVAHGKRDRKMPLALKRSFIITSKAADTALGVWQSKAQNLLPYQRLPPVLSIKIHQYSSLFVNFCPLSVKHCIFSVTLNENIWP